MRTTILSLLVLLLFAACNEDSETYNEDTPARRTVLVYMAAENNLSSYGFDTYDFQEMREASKTLGSDCRLIVYYDGPGASLPYICRLRDGEVIDSVSLQESITADPATLERIIRYTRNKYSATTYGLVLWGHASGWIIDDRTVTSANARRAYGGDTGSGSSSTAGNYWMNIPDMAEAITSAMESDHLTFILADCCNMGSIEIAYELRELTDYLIASPAEIPGIGAPYDIVIPDLFSTSPEFYRAVIDHYYNYYEDFYKKVGSDSYVNGFSVPLAAVRTSALDDLATATNELLSTIPDILQPEGALDLTGITCYGYSEGFGPRVFFNYDMYQVLKQNTDAAAFALWQPYYDAAVTYRRYSARWETMFPRLYGVMLNNTTDATKCGSLAMFFPHLLYSNTTPNFNQSIHQFQWSTAINWPSFGW